MLLSLKYWFRVFKTSFLLALHIGASSRDLGPSPVIRCMTISFGRRATQITEEMTLAAALAIANLIPESQLSDTNILPEAFDPQVTDVVAKAVMDHIR